MELTRELHMNRTCWITALSLTLMTGPVGAQIPDLADVVADGGRVGDSLGVPFQMRWDTRRQQHLPERAVEAMKGKEISAVQDCLNHAREAMARAEDAVSHLRSEIRKNFPELLERFVANGQIPDEKLESFLTPANKVMLGWVESAFALKDIRPPRTVLKLRFLYKLLGKLEKSYAAMRRKIEGGTIEVVGRDYYTHAEEDLRVRNGEGGPATLYARADGASRITVFVPPVLELDQDKLTETLVHEVGHLQPMDLPGGSAEIYDLSKLGDVLQALKNAESYSHFAMDCYRGTGWMKNQRIPVSA